MKCLDRITIQKLIDNELDVERLAEIESHLEECEECTELLEKARLGKSEVNDFLTALNDGEDSISVPPFHPNLRRPTRSRKRNPISLVSKVAAGIALLVGLFWITQSRSSSQELTPEQADLLLLELMGNMEPNKAWHSGQMGIIIIDEDGDVLQSFISNDTE
jgi:anti-sigma factor RsiW